MTTSELPDDEELLTDPDERLWRNVNPSWLDGEKITSQAFKPTPKDEQRLSSARSTEVNAAEHYTEFTETLGLRSVGVWAVTVGDVAAEGLSAVYDEKAETAPDPCPRGHTYIDFTGLSGNRSNKIGARLRDKALDHGRQHP